MGSISNLNQKTPWQRCIGYTSISIAWDADVKSMFFTMCLRSLVVGVLERYSKDLGPGGDTCFFTSTKVASSWRTPLQVAPEGVLT